MAKRKSIFRMQRPSTKIKRKISKATGIPLTKSGRKAKLRRACMPSCTLPIAIIAAIVMLIAHFV